MSAQVEAIKSLMANERLGAVATVVAGGGIGAKAVIDNLKEEPEDLLRGRADLDRVGQHDVF